MILVRLFKNFTFGKKVPNFDFPILFLLKVLSLGKTVKLEKNHIRLESHQVLGIKAVQLKHLLQILYGNLYYSAYEKKYLPVHL